MARYENVNRGFREMMFNNFMGGMAWALGATIGLSIIIAFLGLLSDQVSVIPFLGNFISDLIEFINANNPNLVQ